MCRASPTWVRGLASAAYLSYCRPRFRPVQCLALTLSILLNFNTNWASFSLSVVQLTWSQRLPLICLTRLSYYRVTQIMSSIAGGVSVRPTWVPPGCLWHLLLSYFVPVQLGSVPFRCCGCWLCLGGSGSVGRAVAVPPCCVHKVSIWPFTSCAVAGNVGSLVAHSESC